jgi:hypothetical protein
MRRGISFPTVSENLNSNSALIFRRFLIRGVNYNLAFFACAFALTTDAGLFLQNEMKNAPFARRHGVKAKRRMGFADAAGRDASGKFQFLDANAAIAGGVKSNATVELRIEPKPAQGNMFERQEKFRVAFEQQVLIAAFKLDENFRIFKLRRRGRARRTNFIGELETAFLKERIDAAAQFRRDCRMIQSSIHDQIRASCGRQDCSPRIALLYRYFFFPGPLEGFGGGGAVRYRYHCWPIPTILLVRIYTDRPAG